MVGTVKLGNDNTGTTLNLSKQIIMIVSLEVSI